MFQFVDVTAAQMLQHNLLAVCNEAKNGASRGYIEIRLRAVLAGSHLSSALKHLNLIPDTKFTFFIYNLYLMACGLRAPKYRRS